MRALKIVLVNPPLTAKEQAGSLKDIANIIMPLGIGYIGSVLKKNNYDVEIIDCVPLRMTKERLTEILINKKADVIAFTATIVSINRAIETAEYLKEKIGK